MFHKLNVKILIISLAVLLAIYLAVTFIGDRDRSYNSEIVAADTSRVTDIYISIPKDNANIRLSRTGGTGDWEVAAGDARYPADQNVVRNILSQFSDLKTERIAATSKEKWNQFEVSDSAGTRVTLKNGNKEIADLYIGKFSYAQPPQSQGQPQNPYQQQRGKMTTFVRNADDETVFAVEGFLKMAYQKEINSYRKKNLLNVTSQDMSRLVFTYPDNKSFTLAKYENHWMVNDIIADSVKTVRYLNKIAKLSSSDFVTPATVKTGDAVYKLLVEGNNFSPVEILAYPSDTLVKWVMTSSMNPGAEYNGNKAKLFEKVFVSETEFFPGENPEKKN